MNSETGKVRATFADEDGSRFLIRWRGKQEGPYPSTVIEAKLAANQIGLLHEILHKGQWVTLRDYLAEREASLRAELKARQEQERQAREEAERQAKEREEQRRAEQLAEERRRNDLLQASLTERHTDEPTKQSHQVLRKPHRAGSILALGLIGLLVCGPLCIAAWVMGDSDLREMDAGVMDDSGRSTTATGRTLGALGTILWIIGVAVLFLM